MPTLTNKNTTQTPMAAFGRTGQQVVKFIPASRVYVKSPDTQSGAPVQNYFNISNGETPDGWIDLGVISGNGVAIKYNQKVDQVTTGIDNYLRAAYLSSKGAEINFSLGQFDDFIISTITGITPDTLPNNGVGWGIGSQDMVKLAVLLVSQDKLTGKEFQFYNPCVYIQFDFDYAGDGLELKCTGYVPFFAPDGSSVESLFNVTVFAPVVETFGTYVMSFSNRMAVTIPHNLGTTNIVPGYSDPNNYYTEYGDFQILNANNALMTFSQAVGGYVTITAYTPSNCFAQSFTSQSTVTVVHGLNTTAVNAVVYNSSNVQIQYTALTVVNSNTVIVTFSDNETGRVLVYTNGQGQGQTLSPVRLTGSGILGAGIIFDGAVNTLGTTITVTGANVGYATRIAVSPALPAGVMAIGKVTSQNTVSVELWNASGSSISPGSGTYTAMVFVNGGTYLSGNANITPGAILDGAVGVQNTTISVPGANVGSPVEIQLAAPLPSGVNAFGKVSSSGTVTVEIWNLSGATVTLSQATYTALVLQ